MTSPREEEAVARAIELLLDCQTARERSDVLLDTLLESGFCRSAALWRQVGRGDVRAWHPILARGPATLLPTLDELRCVVAGELPFELGGGRAVLLPLQNCDFALTLATASRGGSGDEDEIENAEALFEVWLAVEVAEAAGQGFDLLDALPGLHETAAPRTPAPDLALEQLTFPGPTQRELTVFLEREAAWLLGPAVDLELHVADLPHLAANPIQLETCLRELLTSAAVGMTRRVEHVRVSVEPADAAAPGALITLEDDAGELSCLSGQTADRHSRSLFLATEAIHAAGGSLRLDPASLGGMRVTAWLPAG